MIVYYIACALTSFFVLALVVRNLLNMFKPPVPLCSRAELSLLKRLAKEGRISIDGLTPKERECMAHLIELGFAEEAKDSGNVIL